jgi:hypothetical protein
VVEHVADRQSADCLALDSIAPTAPEKRTGDSRLALNRPNV